MGLGWIELIELVASSNIRLTGMGISLIMLGNITGVSGDFELRSSSLC